MLPTESPPAVRAMGSCRMIPPFEDRPNAWSVCTSQRFEKWYRKFGKECIAEVLPCSEESSSWRTPCKCGSGPAPSLCVAGHTCCQHQTATCLGEPSDIVKLYAIIQSMKLEMESLRQNIGQNTVGITKNTEGITKNTAGITTHTDSITKNTEEITKNTGGITKNTDGITKNTDGITKNAEGITKNTEGITKNTEGITTNTGGITKNTEGITKNTEGITKNTEGITKNTQGITKNTQGITKNTGGITKNSKGITTNTAALGTKCDMATCTDIQTTATKLESCLADTSSADCPPSASGKIGIIDTIPKGCGNILHPDPVGGPPGWTLCFIDETDISYQSTPCRDLLEGIPVYGNAANLLAAGGNFGCWHGRSGSQEGAYYATNDVVSNSCSDNIQHSSSCCSTGVWSKRVTTFGVCIRYP